METKSAAFEQLPDDAFDPRNLIEFQPGSIVSRVLVQRPSTTVTLFAVDDGQRISEHRSSHDAFIQLLEGTAGVTVAGDEQVLEAPEAIALPPEVPHALEAPSSFKMLLTMVRE